MLRKKTKEKLRQIHNILNKEFNLSIKLSILSPNVMKAMYLFVSQTSPKKDKDNYHNGLYLQYPENSFKPRILISQKPYKETPINVLLHEWAHAILCNYTGTDHKKAFKIMYDYLKKIV